MTEAEPGYGYTDFELIPTNTTDIVCAKQAGTAPPEPVYALGVVLYVAGTAFGEYTDCIVHEGGVYV